MTRPRERSFRGSIGRRFAWRRDPAGYYRRRRAYGVGLVILLASLAIADRVRPWRSGPSQGAAGDDVARYHNRVFRVTEVVDGDTLHVDAPDGTHPYTKIRLWGVDTPEVHGVDVPDHYGPEASAFTHVVADRQWVRLELLAESTRDRYRRVLAYVYLPDGTMLNERLVEEGYGYADTRFAHPFKTKFGQLERLARKGQIGLWREVTVEKMPGWRRDLERRRR